MKDQGKREWSKWENFGLWCGKEEICRERLRGRLWESFGQAGVECQSKDGPLEESWVGQESPSFYTSAMLCWWRGIVLGDCDLGSNTAVGREGVRAGGFELTTPLMFPAGSILKGDLRGTSSTCHSHMTSLVAKPDKNHNHPQGFWSQIPCLFNILGDKINFCHVFIDVLSSIYQLKAIEPPKIILDNTLYKLLSQNMAALKVDVWFEGATQIQRWF